MTPLNRFESNQPIDAEALNTLAVQASRSSPVLGSGLAYGVNGANAVIHVAMPPQLAKGFWAKIFIPSSSDYTNERYFIYRQRVTGGSGMTAQLTREDDTPPTNDQGNLNEPWPLTATNRAEIKDHTHLLTDGMEVWVVAEMDYAATPTVHYSFFAQTPAGLNVIDCADTSVPTTDVKFYGGLRVQAPNAHTKNVDVNIIADPANPGILVTLPTSAPCDPIKLGLAPCTTANSSATGIVTNTVYSGGVFSQTKQTLFVDWCNHTLTLSSPVTTTVFSTTTCPTTPGVAAAEFFAYNV